MAQEQADSYQAHRSRWMDFMKREKNFRQELESNPLKWDAYNQRFVVACHQLLDSKNDTCITSLKKEQIGNGPSRCPAQISKSFLNFQKNDHQFYRSAEKDPKGYA